MLDDLNEKQMSDPEKQARFKQSKHNKLSSLIISEG